MSELYQTKFAFTLSLCIIYRYSVLAVIRILAILISSACVLLGVLSKELF